MKRTTTKERLKELMQERGLKQIDIVNLAKPFCEKSGIKLGRNDISQYLSGKVMPGQHKLFVLAQALDVSLQWLMGYDAPIENESSSPSHLSLVVSDSTKHLLNNFESLNSAGKKKLIEYSDDLVALGRYAVPDGQMFRAARSTDKSSHPMFVEKDEELIQKLKDAPAVTSSDDL